MIRSVLIADRDKERARGLAKACMAARHTVYFARDGATALEVALAKLPALVIADADLPLIRARKLAEILRTNPRTQAVRFFFLGGLEQLESSLDLFDEVISEPIVPEQVAEKATRLFDKREHLANLEGQISGETEIEGDLSLISVVDILQFFHLGRMSGTISFLRPGDAGGEERGWVSLREGDVLGGSVDTVEGEKALFRLFTWEQGRFEFVPEGMEDEETPLRASTRALLMEGVRQLDEWREHRAELPALDARVSLSIHQADLPNMVHPLTQEVLVSLELYDRVRDIVDHCSFPDYQVLRTLQTLETRGMVSIEEPKPRKLPAAVQREEGDELFSAPQERRLLNWLDSKHTKTLAAVDAKLVVVSNRPQALAGFVDVLANLHGCTRNPDAGPSEQAAPTLHEIARISVVDDASIVFLNLPVDPVFGPLWQLVGYGGLGVLFVLDGDLAEAVSAVRPVLEQLRRVSRLRLFFLRLGEVENADTRRRIGDVLGFAGEDLVLFFLPEPKGRSRAFLDLLAGLLP